ncbi:hypothetical protein ANN_05929 [Periplaneta americana]|uniref:Uncharacterized protein n=1 Tax=Periplaneta americana TaxID=6978 RepID=A0ABQ8TE70_PERAM|nr:hypothetical protein ANN_05929 [Periplaneta americana]
MAGLCEGGNEPPGSLKANNVQQEQSKQCNMDPGKNTTNSKDEVSNKNLNDPNTLPAGSSSDGEVVELKRQIMELRKSVATLKESVRAIEINCKEKHEDICVMLIKCGLENKRLREIIWALHPSMNLEEAFSVDPSVVLNFGDNESFGSLNAHKD